LNLLIDLQRASSATIAARARGEAQTLQRVAQLRREGLWSIKRLPKLVEPERAKSHWDFLLDEVVWMATDFQQERRWKGNAARKVSFLFLFVFLFWFLSCFSITVLTSFLFLFFVIYLLIQI
jgi:hypothetical protein